MCLIFVCARIILLTFTFRIRQRQNLDEFRPTATQDSDDDYNEAKEEPQEKPSAWRIIKYDAKLWLSFVLLYGVIWVYLLISSAVQEANEEKKRKMAQIINKINFNAQNYFIEPQGMTNFKEAETDSIASYVSMLFAEDMTSMATTTASGHQLNRKEAITSQDIYLPQQTTIHILTLDSIVLVLQILYYYYKYYCQYKLDKALEELQKNQVTASHQRGLDDSYENRFSSYESLEDRLRENQYINHFSVDKELKKLAEAKEILDNQRDADD